MIAPVAPQLPSVPMPMLRPGVPGVPGSPWGGVATGWSPLPSPASLDPGSSLLLALADAVLGPTAGGPVGAAAATAPTPGAQAPSRGVVDAVAGTLLGAAPGAPSSPVAAAGTGAAAATAAQLPLRARATEAVRSAATGAATAAQSVTGGARQVGSELWAGVANPRAVHVTQVPSKFNPSPRADNRDCGPASVVMSLRMLGKQVPGLAASASPQRAIDRARELTGNMRSSNSTSNIDLERALRSAGTKTREIADAASVKASVLAGRPVILNGNPRNPGAYGPSFPTSTLPEFNGAHWIVVSGIDSSTGRYIINDPMSKAGPLKVTAAQLEGYRGGSMGIVVER